MADGPTFVDRRPDKGKGDKSGSIKPMLLKQLSTQAKERGYDPKFLMALSGAETRFGNDAYGWENPLSYTWKENENPGAIAEQSRFTKQVDETIKGLKEDGMPEEHANSLRTYMMAEHVMPSVATEKAIDVLDEKKKILKKTKRGVTPERLAWLYQGTGVPNKKEIPNGIAYGKPVQKNTPDSPQPRMVRAFMDELNSPKSEVYNYLKEMGW